MRCRYCLWGSYVFTKYRDPRTGAVKVFASCPDCGTREKVKTYRLTNGGAGILCIVCKTKSFHPDDVGKRYCAYCDLVHNRESTVETTTV